MTPDLPTRVRVAFDGELAKCAGSYDACCEEHQDAALAAVIAVVQEDRTACWQMPSPPTQPGGQRCPRLTS